MDGGKAPVDGSEEDEHENERIYLPDQVLDEIEDGNNSLPLYMGAAALCWTLGSMPLMASSFTADTNNATMETLVSEFNLTDSRAYLADLPTSAYMAGNMIGGLFLTTASDRWGRRPVLVSTLILFWISGLLAALSPSILVFGILRAFQGCFYTGSTITAWVAGYEMTPTRLRGRTTFLFGMAWVIGYTLVAPLAYVSTSWRWLLVYTVIPSIPFSFWALRYYPETLHFLANRSRVHEMEGWLLKISNREKLQIQASQIRCQAVQEKIDVWREIWKYKIFLLYSVIMIYLWVCDTFTYFGLSLYSTQLSEGKWASYVLMGAVEVPAYIFTPTLLDRFGRRTIVASSHFLAALAFFTLLCKPGEWLVLSIWLIGKSAITMSFMALFVYASEVFPTNIRNASVGMCAVIARIGGIAAPQIKNMTHISENLPEVVLTVICLIAACATLLLPETACKPLPATILQSVEKPTAKLIGKSEKLETV